MAEELTLQQRQAVENRGGKLLVSAAAGSGKTKVLVDRLMGYLTDPANPANIDEFLLITYTKAAAAELRGKIAAKLSQCAAQDPQNRHLQRQMQRLYLTKISTVHAFCGDILREYAFRMDLPGDFRVADENECREIRANVMESLLKDAYDRAAEDGDFRAFVDTQGLGRDDRQVPELVQKVYDSARCHLQPEKWLARCRELVAAGDIPDAAETLYGKFLLERLRDWLDLQIAAMERCGRLCGAAEGCQKAAALMADTVAQLRYLRDSRTWDEAVRRKKIEFGRLSFPRNFADEVLKEKVRTARDACKKGLEKQTRAFSGLSDQVLSDLASSEAAVRGLIALTEAFGRAFGQAKRSRRVLDFGDLEHRMLDLLLGKNRSGVTSAADEIGSRFREVMVDEYQDSNTVQDAIYSALTQKRQNLFMVGDVKQSIYQFRLADPGIFLEKYAAFRPVEDAVPGQGRKVMLSRNFRSSGGVLAACNDVFRRCMCPAVGGLHYGADEALYEGIPHTPLGEPETELFCIDVQEQTYPEEAAFVAEHIRTLLNGTHLVRDGEQLRPIRPEDIVILLRSPGSAGIYFQRALEQVGIRCTAGGGVDLLKTEEIAALRALLQAIQNPRLDIPLIAAMASPIFGFTADDLAVIRGKNKKCAFFEALRLDEAPKSKAFLRTLLELRQALADHPLTGLLEEILLRTGLDDLYGAMEDGAARRANLEAFFQLAADFEAGGGRDLGRFLEYLDAMEEQGLVSAGEQSAAGCVTIMSIHKSKGLEFPVVFLCGLGREFNMESRRADILCHKSMGLGLSAADTGKRIRYPTLAKRAIAARIGEESVSEELRVLYVAMTRARDRLIMTYASNRLRQELSQMVRRMDLGSEKLLIREAVCPGDWVLLTALRHTEAGELFALGGRPEETVPGDPPWRIRVVTAPAVSGTPAPERTEETLPPRISQRIREGLAFHYAHEAATAAPSKQTATQRKGRIKDAEAAEDTVEPARVQRQWRKPSFLEPQRQGRDYGTALHAAMQYIDYAACGDEASVRRELRRLVERRYLSEEQGRLVNCGSIAAFFRSPLGQKLRQGGNVVREFKFSILEDGAAYNEALAGERVLLQGVVDCALIEPDGITVLDFKTDFVTDQTIAAKAERYRPQVEAYSEALRRIYRLPVKEALLYFFHMDRFVSL